MTNSYAYNSTTKWNPSSSEEAAVDKSVKEKPERFGNDLKVYVKNLPLDDKKSWDAVIEKLSTCGQIKHHHFFEKKLAGQKIQLGLVVFTSEDEAKNATKLTGTEVGGRHIIVSRYRQFAQCNSKMVHISNLSVTTDEEVLWQFFEGCGTIKFIHIDRPLNASSLKAEVHFKSEKGVLKALKLNDELLEGNKICVGASAENQLEEGNQANECTVFVGGLPRDIQKDHLLQYFGDYGPIKRIKIILREEEEDANALIYYLDSKSATSAELACNGNELNGHILTVTQRAEGMLQYEFLNPVFIAGISRDSKDVDIFLKFQDCGRIHDIKFVQSKPGSMKKCCIEFEESESVEKAFAVEDLELNGQILVLGRTREVWSGQHLVSKSKKRKGKREKSDGSILSQADDSEVTPRKKRIQEDDGILGDSEDQLSTILNNTVDKKKNKKKKRRE